MIRKIISGGQTGADRGGLVAARNLGIETGGWAPKGFRTDAGPDPLLASRYGLRGHTSPSYPPRTRLNVLESDGTLIIIRHNMTPGSRMTKRLCKKHKKPYLIVRCTAAITQSTVACVSTWIEEHEIEVLNVAGSRERTSPGIFDFTVRLLENVLRNDCGLAGEGER